MLGFNWIDTLPEHIRTEMLQKAKISTILNDHILYQEGDPITSVFQIIDGQIKKSILTESGQEILLYVYSEGELIADSAVVDQLPYPVTLTSRGTTKLRVWQAEDIHYFRHKYVEVEEAMIQQVNRRLRAALQLVKEILTLPVSLRIASRVSQINGMKELYAQDTHLILSQMDIGMMVGTTRQTVNKTLQQMKALGLIESHYGKIKIRDKHKLEEFIQENLKDTDEI